MGYNPVAVRIGPGDAQAIEAEIESQLGKTCEGLIRSHFAVDEEGKLTEHKIKVKPDKTVDLALRLIQL